MKRAPASVYLEKAMLLTRNEAEHVLSRMRSKWMRRVEDRKIEPLEAVALQLQKEDEDLQIWRERWAEVKRQEAVADIKNRNKNK